MGAQALLFILPLALLIHQAGAGCVYSWDSADLGHLGPCDSCAGSCDPGNGCSCSDGVNACLPNVNVSCIDPALCCPPGLYYSSAESCCTDIPTCSTPCATDEACDVATCVCNATNYQDETHADIRPGVICEVYIMSVALGQCQLSSFGYDVTTMHLIDTSEDCDTSYSTISNGRKVFILQSLETSGWCGNSVTELESRLYVTNTVSINVYNVTIDPIIFTNPISFTVTCPILTGVNPITQTVMISGVNVTGQYPLTMAAYKDPDFVNPFEMNDMVLGSDIYVTLYVFYTDSDYVLRLQDCAASPTTDRYNTKALHLLSEGCATDNLTRIIQNGNSTEVRMEISSLQFPDFATIHLFCDARLCARNEEECTMCKESQSFSIAVTELQIDLKIRGFSMRTFQEDNQTSFYEQPINYPEL